MQALDFNPRLVSATDLVQEQYAGVQFMLSKII